MIQDTETGDKDYSYSTLMTSYNSKSIIFQVQTASDAMVAISSEDAEDDPTNVYEIGLGIPIDETVVSVIRRGIGGPDKVSEYTPDILSDSEYRTFWLSWETPETIECGRGHIVGMHTLVSWTDETIDTSKIDTVAITSGKNTKATWRISSFEGLFHCTSFKIETVMKVWPPFSLYSTTTRIVQLCA